MKIETISDYDIREGRTEIDFPYKDGKLTATHPFFGPYTYLNAGKQILEKNLIVPNGDEIAAFLHAAYLGPEEFTKNPQIREISDIMTNRCLWNFNRNFYGLGGVYVVQDPEVKGRIEEPHENQLESILNDCIELNNGVRISRDGKVRFAPKDSYRFGEHTSESFAKDGFVIASFNIDGAKQLSEVSKKFNFEPKTSGVELGKDDKPEQRVSALKVLYDYYGGRLFVDGRIDVSSGFYAGRSRLGAGYAFGVLN